VPRIQAILAISLLLVVGCASGLGRPVTSVEPTPDADGVQRVSVDLHSFYFHPNRIVVKSGRPVELTVHNRAVLVPHELEIDSPGLRLELKKWGFGSARARFTAPQPGEYRFACHVDGHAKKGMAGTLVVVP
jgi:uncharacterized cupredoxin-like copper-binding protein